VPELPEVETLVRGAKKKLVDKTIKDIKVSWPKAVGGNAAGFTKMLAGKKIQSASRRGKLIILELSGDVTLLTHLKLTGQLVYEDKDGKLYEGGHPVSPSQGGPEKVLYGAPLPHKFTVVEITFSDGSKLYFNDLRKFGWMKVSQKINLKSQKELAELGIEPMDKECTVTKLKELLAKKPKTKIKEFLMDQSLIAGLGNIYSSEILWEAKIAPRRPAGDLKPAEVGELHRAIGKVLEMAIKMGGSSENTYVRLDGSKGNYMDEAKVYQKEGPCPRKDGGKIKREKIGGRSAFWCEKCQK
jgi:formamidopyrimidine-DNA glycosylase